MNDLVISRLTRKEAPQLSQLLSSAQPEYRKYFFPFASDSGSLETRLSGAKKDRYWGVWVGEKLVGLAMLRGWDEGYERPALGCFISQEFSNRGLLGLSLQYCMCWSRLNGIPAVLSKVSPQNTHMAQGLKRAGFVYMGKCPQTGLDMMELRIREVKK